ncbi:hypothetical protein G6F40_015080 [Rhizopus arrhizus]|nr:hypothetical protein G6F40_015080 [Rhizopus arrhizus]
MQDLLSTQAGIHLINTSSSSDNAIVDLRGFGITGASNTRIMIDGVKQNTNDLSAPGLGVVPLDQVERVEIVRGSGSVQYGGGTTGGVVNIITRQNFEGAEIGGSFGGADQGGLHEQNLKFVGGLGDLDTDGYNILRVAAGTAGRPRARATW